MGGKGKGSHPKSKAYFGLSPAFAAILTPAGQASVAPMVIGATLYVRQRGTITAPESGFFK